MGKFDAKKSLLAFLKNNPNNKQSKETEKETDSLFLSYMENYANYRQQQDQSFKVVPKFFDQNMLYAEKNKLQNLIQKQARSKFLQHKTTEILDKDDLEKLWEEIKQNISPPEDGNERINYDSFLKIAKSLPPKCRHFFSASTFLKFDRDEYGRIDCVSFFHSIVRKISLFDSKGNGYLTNEDLVKFLESIIPTFPNLADIDQNLKQKFLIVSSKKFFFFLDPRKSNRIFIKDILTSPILAELYDLRSDKTHEEFLNNWFSKQNTQRILNLFEKLDKDNDDLLNNQELKEFQWGLTELFIKRILETFTDATTNYKLNFENFVELILIIENKKTRQSLQFMFETVDIFEQEYIDTFVINTFFKEILKKLLTKDNEADKNFKIEDVKDEIFDMANPLQKKIITLQDLINCGQGDTILSILVDAKAFFDYDQRELGNTLNVEEDSHFEVIPGINDKKENENQNFLSDLNQEETKPKSFGKYAETLKIFNKQQILMEKKRPRKKLRFHEALQQVDKETRKIWEDEQKQLCKQISYKNEIPDKIKYVCGMDLTFSTQYPDIAITSVIITDSDMKVIAKHSQLFHVEVPYVPSFLAFREIKPMIETYKNLMQRMKKKDPNFDIDLIFVDGNGILHPRECGLAVHLGVELNKPTIGCAKTMFAIDGLKGKSLIDDFKRKFKKKGDQTCHELLRGKSGKIWGAAVKNTAKAYVPLIISVGNKVTIEDAVQLVYEYSKSRVVEPVRLADKESRYLMRKFEKFIKNKHLTEYEAMKIFKINQFIY